MSTVAKQPVGGRGRRRRREREKKKIGEKGERERQKEVLSKAYPTKFPVQMYLVPAIVIL